MILSISPKKVSSYSTDLLYLLYLILDFCFAYVTYFIYFLDFFFFLNKSCIDSA